jgi:transposase
MSRKETRFVSDVNHCLSKTIANSDFKVFCFETLKIKKKKRTLEERQKDKIFRSQEKAFNKKLNGWSFGQLEKFVTYKIENKGKIIVKAPTIFPSSQICSSCGHKEKENRQGSRFKCLKCGYELH